MTRFDDLGFLSEEAKAQADARKLKEPELIERSRALVADCHRFAHEFSGNGANPKHLLVGTLFSRALEAYQSVFLLAANGMDHAASISLRWLCEAIFNLGAIVNSDEILSKKVYESRLHKLKYYNRATNSKSKHLGLLRTKEARARRELLKKQVEEDDIRSVNVEELARVAGMSEFYDTVYMVLSSKAHCAVLDLEKSLLETERGLAIDYGPGSEMIVLLTSAGEMMYLGLAVSAEVFELDYAEICKGHQRFFNDFYKSKKKSN